MRSSRRRARRHAPLRHRRAGVAAVDYFLLLGVIMPLAVLVMPLGMRVMRAVFEMFVVLVSWPFL